MISAIGSSNITTNRRATIPPKVAKRLGIEAGSVINFYEDEYGRIIIMRATAESILSTLEIPEIRKPAKQKIFP